MHRLSMIASLDPTTVDEHIICTQPYRPAALYSVPSLSLPPYTKNQGFTINTLTFVDQTLFEFMRASKKATQKSKQANFEDG